MKKTYTIVLTIAAALMATTSQAQIFTPGGDIGVSQVNNDNVGIGTSEPEGKLHISGHTKDVLLIKADGENRGENWTWEGAENALRVIGLAGIQGNDHDPNFATVFNINRSGRTEVGEFTFSPGNSNVLNVRRSMGIFSQENTFIRLWFAGSQLNPGSPRLSWRAPGDNNFLFRNDETNITAMTLSKEGKVGVGTDAFAGNHHLYVDGSSALREMFVQKPSKWGEDDEYIRLRYNTQPMLRWESSEDKDFEFYGNGNRSMVLSTEGKVGIGTAHFMGDHSLYVDGSMIAEEAFIKLKSTWPDYVFQPDYHLMPLDELGTYIGTNGRLPGMPSAAQVAEEGAAIGENQRLLTEKVEELTLYLLEMSSRLRSMTEQYDAVNEEMEALREEITTLRGEK